MIIRIGPATSLLIASLVLAGLAQARAEEPLSITYGPRAATAEGDPDFRDTIYLRVPDTTHERLYIRVFDPDIGGAHDLQHGAGFDTRMRYTIFGGKGAGSPPTSPPPDPGAKPDRHKADLAPLEAPSLEVLAKREYGEDPAADDAWVTLASVSPEQGDHVGDQYVFRLDIEGLSGDDGNLYEPTLSLRDRRNVAPAGLSILDWAPTVRIPAAKVQTEVAFDLPADAERITIHNFDAASGDVAFASIWRTVPMAASGQGDWRQSDVTLLPEERGTTASVVMSGGVEMPNDLTLYITDQNGRMLPMRLPARAFVPNNRPQPVAGYTLLAECSAVAFDATRSSDADGDRLSYHWELGDGAQSDEGAMVHRYPGPGTYRGALYVRDSSGQVGDGAVAPFAVTLKRPPSAAAEAARLTAPGVPLPFDGSGSVAGDRPIAHYEWDFQDGSKAEGAKVTHAFARSGRYVVTLRVRDDQPGPCDSSVTQTIVDVNSPPVAVAGADRHAAVGETVKLDGRGSYDIDGEIVAWTWDLGDGATASGSAVSHAYDHPGTYTATLTVRDGAGLANSTATSTVRTIVNDPPVAMPGPERHVAVGEIIPFDGRASVDRDGKLVHYDWTFGDGSSGSGAQVPYAYSEPGRFQATLTVVDDSGTSSNTSSASALIVVNAPPVAKAGPDQLVTSSEVSFDGTGSSDPDGAIASYAWDFGDGTTGSGPKPTHVYRKSGAYLVQLTVTDDSGTIRNSASDTLHVLVNQAPVADAGPDQLAAPGQVLTFDGSASQDPDGDIVAWSWSFGDGTSADGQRVRHSYAKSGVYQVQLTVRDNTGQPNAIGFDQARVTVNAPPVAKAGPDLLAAPGDKVTLDGSSSFDEDGKITSWRWDFSDRSDPVEGRTVTRTYAAPGVYAARLTVTDDSGAINGVAQDEVAIRINHQPVANAGKDITSSSTDISFDASASADADGDALVYSWDFGDGSPPGAGVRTTHSYAEGGSYPVVLTVDDGTGLHNARSTAALTVLIDRPPVANAGGNREACGGSVVVFDGSKSRDPEGGLLRYHWDFGDGTGADIVNPTKTYVHGGAYPVTLSVEDDSGFPGNRDTDRILVRVHNSPIAVAGPDQLSCAGGEVHFDGSGSRNPGGVVSRYSWNFGDGTTGSSDRPVHVFTKPGDYRVVLTIEGDQAGQCANTNSGEMSVKVIEAPIARIAAPAAVPVGAAAHFDASLSTVTAGQIAGWHWDFGDGGSAEGAAVDHTFEKAGRYVTVLTLDTAGGVATCSRVTTQHAIVANASPVAVAGGERTVGTGEEVLFDASASHDEDGGIVDYKWDFADGTTASGVNVRHRFGTAGRYPVKLTVTDNTNLPNNQGSDVAMVTVDQPPEAVITRPPAACPAETLAFSGTGSHDTGGSITSYSWSFGDGGKAEGPNVTHSYAAPGLFELALTVDDGSGLANARQQTALPFRVNRAPRAQAGPDRLACPDQDVAFDGSASVDWDGQIKGYSWDFGDGGTAQGARATHRFTSPGSYDVRLTVEDDSNSSCAADTSLARVTVIAPPVAQAGGDLTGYVGGAHDELLFDASASKGRDGRPLAYEWDLGDGTVLAGERVRHAYAKPGQYPVRLTVSDDSGLACGKAADSIKVEVDSRH